MKKQAYTTLMIAVLIATAFNSAQAQSDWLIKANVPFNFVIRDRTLPAGEYVFELVHIGGSEAIKIRSADGNITAFAPARSERAKASNAKLTFNRYESQFFLSQVDGLEATATQVLAKSRVEERLIDSATERSRVSVAASKR